MAADEIRTTRQSYLSWEPRAGFERCTDPNCTYMRGVTHYHEARRPIGGIDRQDAFTKMRAQLMLIRVTLGLNPIHDPVEAIRVLFEEGREAFEKLRGPACEHAHEWGPL